MHPVSAEALMAEYSPRDPDPNAPQNPPQSVANRDVRRTALRTYLLPIVGLFLVIGLALLYWASRPPVSERAANQPSREDPNVAGTAGERNPDDNSPGGHEPQRTPDSTADEIQHRGGHAVTELGALLEENAHGEIGRRVEIQDVDVEQVDSPTSFWVRDGNARVQVIAPSAGAQVRQGQQVNLTGVAERSGNVLRIRASKVSPSQ
jgi:hypothetical protein